MYSTHSEAGSQNQRITIESEAENLKIRTERYDKRLGWYTAGALTIPAHQLPLLEQELSRVKDYRARIREERGRVILFPAAGERLL